jgi:hypothetical protein
MKTFANVLSLTIAIVAVIFALVPQHVRADPPPGQVTVINTAGQPVPVNGSVAATQSGSWTVGINGTPSITIANTPSAPVPIQNVDEYGRQPFQQFVSIDIPDGSISGDSDTFTVPVGKRLVIEHVSGQIVLTTPGFPRLLVRPGGSAGFPQLVMSEKIGPGIGGLEFWGITRQVLMYADSSFDVLWFRDNAIGQATANVVLTGHYINQ